MEWIEIADTATKIGLGAAISGISAYFIAGQTHKNDIDKEAFKRRVELIEKVAERFDVIHMFFFDLTIDYSGYLSGYIKDVSPTKEVQDRYSTYLKLIGQYLCELHTLEGKLLLADITSGTNCLREYRLLATDINCMLNIYSPKETEDQIHDRCEAICSMKDRFYKILANSYRGT